MARSATLLAGSTPGLPERARGPATRGRRVRTSVAPGGQPTGCLGSGACRTRCLWQVGRRSPGPVPRMLPHPGFKIPDAFLQLRDRCPEFQDGRLLLNNQCLQGGDHGWHHSTERGRNTVRHPTPVNGYGRALVPDRSARMPVPPPTGERGRASTCTGHLRGILQQRPTAPRHQRPHPHLPPRFPVNNVVRDNT